MDRIKKIFPRATPRQLEQLSAYCDLLRDWNRRVNLVSRKDIDRLIAHHLLPSLLPLRLVDIKQDAWLLDIGSGGGLPAVPISIMRPDLQILMVDSIRKKTLFLKAAIDTLELRQASVINSRIEVLQENPDFQQKFDLVTARAVTTVNQLMDWAIPFCKPKGFYLFWKGKSDLPELNSGTVAEYRHKVYYPPQKYRSLTPKFEGLCWFRISAK